MDIIQRKYSNWIKKQNLEEIKDCHELVVFFHNNRNKFNHKDIYKYDFTSLKKEIDTHNISSNRQKKYNGAVILEETSSYKLIKLLSFEACKQYLRDTKLCITSPLAYFEFKIESHSSFYTLLYKDLIFPIIITFEVSKRRKKIKIDAFDNNDYEINLKDKRLNHKKLNNLIDKIESDFKSSNNDISCIFNNRLSNARVKSLVTDFIKEIENTENMSYNLKKHKVAELASELVDKDINLALDILEKSDVSLGKSNYVCAHSFKKIPIKKLMELRENIYIQAFIAGYKQLSHIKKINYSDPTIRAILKKRAKANRDGFLIYNKLFGIIIDSRSYDA